MTTGEKFGAVLIALSISIQLMREVEDQALAAFLTLLWTVGVITFFAAGKDDR